jgi:hypothetical protein
MTLARAPTELPAELVEFVSQFGAAWASSVHRPIPAMNVIWQWNSLLQQWAHESQLPLLIRKHRGDRGCEVLHGSGRLTIPTDNSAAHWAFTLACEGKVPTLAEISALFAADKIPVVMVQKAAEKVSAKYHCTLKPEFDVNRKGWKLAHIRPVGVNTRVALRDIPLERLQEQFRALLAPSNMFVVPSVWSGLAEVAAVVEAVHSHFAIAEVSDAPFRPINAHRQ